MDNSQKNKTLIIGTIIYAIGNLGTKFLSFLIVPLYTFYISPSDLGEYDLICTTINLLAPLITLQISDAAYRWMISNEKYVNSCISITYEIVIKNCFISTCIILLINFFIPINYCYYFIGILVTGRILESIQKLLRGLKKQKLFAISGFIYTACFVLLNCFLVCFFKKGVNALFQSAIISNLLTITFIVVVEKKLRAIKFIKSSKLLKNEMLKYSTPLIPSTLNWWVMNASDRYIIRSFLGSEANGIYAVAYKFPSVLSTMFLMFNNSLTDMVLTEESTDLESYYSKVFEKMYILGFSMLFIIVPATKLICNFILGTNYRQSVIYIPFLYLGTIFQAFSSFFAVGYLKGKRTSGAAKTSIYGAIINIVVNIICIKFIGLFAAAISTFIGFFTMWIIRVIQTKKEFPVKIKWNRFIVLFASTMILCILAIWSKNIIDVLILLIGITIFIIINKQEISILVQKMKKIVKKGEKI